MGFVRRVAAVLAVASAVTTAPAYGATYAPGIDVSHWQGTIQWARVAGAGYTFAFGKATESTTYTDPTYAANRTGARAAGLRFGAYHFARPGGSGEAGLTANALAQADYFLDVAQPQPGELPPVLDLEVKGGLNAASLRTWTAAWLAEVAARTGIDALVYSSPNFWKTALADTPTVADAGARLWIAHWTKNATPLVPASNWSDNGWTFWQHTNCASVPGVPSKCVDGDRFNGGDPAAAAIPPYPAGPPAPSAPPTILGAAQAGRSLAGVPGVWSGGKPLTFSYQWQLCDAAGGGCAPVPGATTRTFVPAAADVGHALVLTVTAQAPGGSATASSPPSVAVAAGGAVAARPAATAAPSVGGTAQAGQVLTSSVGTWTGSPTSFAYQWRRCTTQCTAILGATASTYTLTPDDIGATVSLVVTATGKGGATSAAAPTTGVVLAAPVPPAVSGSAAAEPGAAGAVASPDASATVTWQPGAVPVGSTVSLAPSGKGLLLGVSPAPPLLPWPIDLVWAAPTSGVVGTSTDGKAWQAATRLSTPVLPVGQLAGAYVDAAGLTHVLLRAPGRVALFEPGTWGDPSLVAAGPPTPRLVGRVRARRLRDGSVLVTARVRVPSQAHLWVSVQGPSRQSLLRAPGSFPVRARIAGRRLPRGARAQLRVAARDPWGRRAQLVVRFRAP